jgi:hypothetical protein
MVTVGKVSTLNALSSTSLSRRSESVLTTRPRSVAVREPMLAAIATATRAAPTAIAIQRTALVVTRACFLIGSYFGGGA